MSTQTYRAFAGRWETNAQLALDTIAMRPTRGLAVGGFGINDMQWSHLEELSGNPPGSYEKDPVRVYREFQLAAGVCFIDQWIPENPLSMRDQGYESDKPRGATTGAYTDYDKFLEHDLDAVVLANYFPSHATLAPDQPPPSILGAFKPSAKAVASARKIWVKQGYAGE